MRKITARSFRKERSCGSCVTDSSSGRSIGSRVELSLSFDAAVRFVELSKQLEQAGITAGTSRILRTAVSDRLSMARRSSQYRLSPEISSSWAASTSTTDRDTTSRK